jgi:hypothetical protein
MSITNWKKVSQQETKLVANDTSAQRKLVEGVEQVVEHAQEENQQGTTTTLPKVLVLQMNVKAEGHQGG